MTTILDIFRRARANQALTPAERATRKAIINVLIAAGVGFLSALPALTTGFTSFNLGILLGGLATALALALQKFWSAQGDTGLASAAGQAAGYIRNVAGIPGDVVIEPPQPTPVAPLDEAAI